MCSTMMYMKKIFCGDLGGPEECEVEIKGNTPEEVVKNCQEHVMEEIEKGIKNKKKLLRIEDRKKAIQEAIKKANKNDIILITGKGAEENMMVKKNKIPWSDKKITQNYLKKIEKK